MVSGSWLVVATCVGPCQGEGHEVVTVRGQIDTAPEFAGHGGWLHLRAFPDHDDGFSVRRVYLGDVDVITSVPPDEVGFPHRFEAADAVQGEDVQRRWRILGWRSDNPDAEWIEPGDPYGQTTFEFRCDLGCEAVHVDFAIYRVAPPA